MRLKVSLIVQQDMMIPQTETPVLELASMSIDAALSLLPTAVRFLRCGCPSVQWLITTDNFSVCRNGREIQDGVADAVHNALCNLQNPGENFKVESPEVWNEGSVITLTRIIAPKTNE